MNLEESIKLAIENKLKDGSIEKIISEKVEKGIDKVFDDLFGWNGDCKKTIEENVKSVMVPYLEKYDYSQYIVKLDNTLSSIMNVLTKDNRKILGNFKELMSVDPGMKSVKVSEIFSKWCEYVANNIETDGLEIDYDDGVSYQSVEVTYEFEAGEERSWIKQESGRIIFECEHDEKMNVCIDIYRYSDIHKEDMWNFRVDGECNLSSLRYLDEFKLYLMSLKQSGIEIELDEESDYDDITPEKEPEAYFE